VHGKNSLIAAVMAGLLAALVPAFAGDGRQCGTSLRPATARPVETTGGKYLPSRGLVRILLVFASFPDDLTPHPYWPAHQPPTGMSDFLDPDTTTRSTGQHNLTHYFRQMSLGALHVVGDVLWVESARSQEEYRNGAYGRANTDVLKERVDSLVDFSRFDAWSCPSPYEQRQTPDSVVDMIVMVWRTRMFEYLGEASLGYTPAFVLDGKRIEMGFPERFDYPLGSGVTCEYPYNDSPGEAMRTMAHELGHWFLGAAHPYNSFTDYGKHEYWGMLCTSHQVSSCANAYERERLGWITVPELLPGSAATLADFLLTGDARKHHPPEGEEGEYFYLENHQRLSPFDDVSVDPADRGLWILHQNGPYMEFDNLRIEASDGNWVWDNPASTAACFGQELPVFARGAPAVLAGSSHRDQLSTPTSAVEWMFVRRDLAGRPQCGRFFAGEGFRGSFGPDTTSLFSPYSNPSSATWANVPTAFTLETVSDSGGRLTVRSHLSPLDAPPARRYLGTDPAVQTVAGKAALAWGAQWSGAQPLEQDIVASELQQRLGTSGSWTTIYQGAATAWTDLSLPYDSGGTTPVAFRVRLQDTQHLVSPWSNLLVLKTKESVAVRQPAPSTFPWESGLEPAYPNPFNGISNIGFRISAWAKVTLQVYDLLGRDLRTLADGMYAPGKYAAAWDGRDARGSMAASGVYVVRLQVGDRSFTRKIIYAR
jgi:M6 family metalloprotease-like protein